MRRLRQVLHSAILLLAGSLSTLAGSLSVAVISDLNGSYGEIGYSERVHRVVARIRELKPDLVICTGDMIAGQRSSPRLTTEELSAMWREFHRVVTDPLAESGIPLAVAPGNHDASDSSGYKLERDAYESAWKFRRPQLEFLDSDNYPFQYAFRMGGTVFISLDATRNGPLPREEKEWLISVLAKPKVVHTVKVVFSHLPVFPFSRGRETEFLNDQDLRNSLNQLAVNLYLSGHRHAFYPGLDGPTLHIVQACLGSGPRRLIGSDRVSPRAFTLIEIRTDGIADVKAFKEPDLGAP